MVKYFDGFGRNVTGYVLGLEQKVKEQEQQLKQLTTELTAASKAKKKAGKQ